MINRQSTIMLVIGIVIGILLGVAGSSDSLFGTSADKNDDKGSAASVAEPSEAYMLELSEVQAMLAEQYPDRAGEVAAAVEAAESLGDDPGNAPAVIQMFQETVLPMIYEAAGGSEESNAESEADSNKFVICFGIKRDPTTGIAVPYLYTTIPVKSPRLPPSLKVPENKVSNSPNSLLFFELLACYPPSD